MANYEANDEAYHIWLVDNGCSSHMTSLKSLFKELDETQKQIVRLGDNKEVQVEGKRVVAIKTAQNKVKLLLGAQYVPSIVHNLLSVGQLLSNGYFVLFDNEDCIIRDKDTGLQLASVQMTKNRMFPLEVSNMDGHSSVAGGTKELNDSVRWHLHYDHLNLGTVHLWEANKVIISF